MLGIAAIMGLSGCGSDAVEEETNHEEMNHSESTEEASHEEMNHSSSAEVPEGLKEAENPAFKIGSQAIIRDGHMEGMKGAKAVIESAEQTTVYMIDYTPTNGGEKVTNHKWVTESELSAK